MSDSPVLKSANPGSVDSTATGLKGKVQSLAATLQSHNDELSQDRNFLEQIKVASASTDEGTALAAQISDIRRYFTTDVKHFEDDFKTQVNLQKQENVRIQQNLNTLKAEKTSIHQQIIALQRRVEELEEEIGHD